MTGAELFPTRNDLAAKNFWLCHCGSYVGCHPGTTRALGKPANKQTRVARAKAHLAFDRLWKLGLMKRGEAYVWASRVLCIDPLHIGELDVEQCEKLVDICQEKLTEEG